MNTKINLSAEQADNVQFDTRGVEGFLVRFGWLFITAESGEATIEISEDGKARAATQVRSYGLFATELIPSISPNATVVVIRAGASGFNGALHFEARAK